MQVPLQVTFRGMSPVESLEEHVRRRASKLGRYFARLTSCHVVVAAAHKRRHHGKRYRVSIDMRVPGHDVAVARNPNDELAREDAHAAIDDAFDDAKRRLEQLAVRMRERKDRHAAARIRVTPRTASPTR